MTYAPCLCRAMAVHLSETVVLPLGQHFACDCGLAVSAVAKLKNGQPRRARHTQGVGKKLSATGPMTRCEEAVKMAINFMTQEVAPTFTPASTTNVQQMTEEAR